MIDKISYTRTHAWIKNRWLRDVIHYMLRSAGGRAVISQLIVENKFFIVPLIIISLLYLCLYICLYSKMQ